MIKRIYILLLVFLSFTLICNANIYQSDTIFFKGNYDYPPYQLLDKDLNPTGFSVEILNAISKTMGLNIQIELDSWNKIRYELEQGSIDGLAAMSYSEERTKLVSFSTPYTYITHAVFVRNESEIKSFEDINEKEVLVVKGDIMHDYILTNNISKYIIPVKDYQTALRLLSAEEYDCAVINKLQGQFAIKEYALKNLHFTGKTFQPIELCFAVKKNDVDLLAQLNDGLQIIKSTGEYDEIYDKWFSVYEKADIKSQVLKLIFWIIIPFLILLLAILVWSWSLRKQVASKTSELQKELTDRKKAENQLIQEKALLNSMINSIPDLIFYKNRNNIYLGCNEAFCKFNNLTFDDIVGKSDFEIFPKDLANVFHETDNYIIRNNESLKSESWENHANGEKILFTVLKVPFTDEKGNPLGVVGICHDITERYKHEIDLRKAKEKAEESDKLKSSFLANMSHEIRTPMNAIIGFSDLLVDPDIEYDEREELVTHINNNCNTLLVLIDDIIDLAKIEANELSIFRKDTNIKTILSELFDTFKETRKSLSKEQVDIKIDEQLLEKNFFIKTDPFRFKQIMTNLINNAFKYTENGYIKFGYEIIDKDNTVKFYVKDTGIGIPKEKFKDIFKRFNKIESDKSKLYRGTGLGLTITHNLIERLGGTIWVDSEVNVGSTFYFTLPFEQDGNTIHIEPKEVKLNDKSYWEGKTILIAEDEESNFKFLEMLLKGTGLKLLRAKNGYQAIDLCKENKNIDLVLMDIKMPELNGLDATKEIKKLRTNLPVIAQTAHAMHNDEKISLEAGCDDYIAKPILKEKLFMLINKWMI
jgi:PAS domain S-box-containing protein